MNGVSTIRHEVRLLPQGFSMNSSLKARVYSLGYNFSILIGRSSNCPFKIQGIAWLWLVERQYIFIRCVNSFLAHLFNMFYFSVGSLGGAFIIASSEKMTDSLHATRNVWKDSFEDVITYKNNTFKVRYSLASFSDGMKSSAQGGSVSVDITSSHLKIRLSSALLSNYLKYGGC